MQDARSGFYLGYLIIYDKSTTGKIMREADVTAEGMITSLRCYNASIAMLFFGWCEKCSVVWIRVEEHSQWVLARLIFVYATFADFAPTSWIIYRNDRVRFERFYWYKISNFEYVWICFCWKECVKVRLYIITCWFHLRPIWQNI